ncbi:MAG: tRNA/rRNA methyltransferase (SpoU) [Candidatus Uhrbacteria bacterium GW2011_GWE2_40_58]|nr:MAG: tRNA/rRNA methyltransferase (SpoU) [Candidatus Uhrbacteria bacterium GW2011_GWF2_40_263]KKR68108.1 MAG: tRNA/rRNA methyltransferase (SpoU) [Candidatus Uhrbacteria bacterium GW2011_GWE2_40_58]OGL91808.1 MAG: hypothetical protein A2239_04590 [Candidatus Uhrbacteria bacterium RIFOXYA2_FULL_40_9]OGL97258.1 MAG: hypothetical protein A2332_01565 [Candidatus Uhrbacteria bacterium RIFOXYB2_FULL_41_18]HBK34434.1 RNA methyltransferase [Candidatus Uhrbacteria bacterium]
MIMIAHNIRSLHNVGSIFRSADAFGIEKLYLTGFTGTPPRKEIAKVALGSEQRVPWEFFSDIHSLLSLLKSEGKQIVAIETGEQAVSLHSFSTEPHKLVLIVGNEVEGIEKEVLENCDVIVEIPMTGRKRSLNVSVAAGIALFSLGQK